MQQVESLVRRYDLLNLESSKNTKVNERSCEPSNLRYEVRTLNTIGNFTKENGKNFFEVYIHHRTRVGQN